MDLTYRKARLGRKATAKLAMPTIDEMRSAESFESPSPSHEETTIKRRSGRNHRRSESFGALKFESLIGAAFSKEKLSPRQAKQQEKQNSKEIL